MKFGAREPFPLRGGTAVITGAASGIGAALAANLASRGCNLALADLNAAGLQGVASQARAAGVKVSEHRLDVADADAVAALPEAVLGEHGRVSVLINNAGVSTGGTFDQVSPTDFDWCVTINFWGVVWMTRAFLPALRRESAAQIVNLSSVYGLIAPPGNVAYSASKFAVRGFSEALRHELEDAASPVGMTVVFPGGVRTNVAVNARMGGLSNAEVEAGSKLVAKLLTFPPEGAAEAIVRGIERRKKRVLVGNKVRHVVAVERLFPVNYWKVMAVLTGWNRQSAR